MKLQLRKISTSVSVKGDNPFVLVIIFNETFVPEADEWMRHLARDIFKELKNGGRIY